MDDLGKHYVAFLDIVAYSDIIEIERTTMLTAVDNTIEAISKRTVAMYGGQSRRDRFRSQLIGDAVVISLRCGDATCADIMELLDIVRDVQQNLLAEYKILIRGGIAAGNLVSIQGSLTGNALSRAHAISSKENPSFLVVISDEVFKDFSHSLCEAYSTMVAESIIESKVIHSNGITFVRFLDRIKKTEMIDTLSFYQNMDDWQSKHADRAEMLISFFNKAGTGDLIVFCRNGDHITFHDERCHSDDDTA